MRCPHCSKVCVVGAGRLEPHGTSKDDCVGSLMSVLKIRKVLTKKFTALKDAEDEANYAEELFLDATDHETRKRLKVAFDAAIVRLRAAEMEVSQ